MHGHGVAHFLREKFFECSDEFYVYICKKCKLIANVNKEENIHYCSCDEIDFDKIALPYSTKLLFYELMGMGITLKIHV